MISIKILRNKKLSIDVVNNGLTPLYVDLIVQDGQSGRIEGWFGLNKEQLEEVIKDLLEKLKDLC